MVDSYVIELSWLVEQLQKEVEALGATRFPLVHWFLILQLARAIVKRTEALGQCVRDEISGEAVVELAG